MHEQYASYVIMMVFITMRIEISEKTWLDNGNVNQRWGVCLPT